MATDRALTWVSHDHDEGVARLTDIVSAPLDSVTANEMVMPCIAVLELDSPLDRGAASRADLLVRSDDLVISRHQGNGSTG